MDGEGPAVILLHGWGASLQTFHQLKTDLSSNFKVYALDLPGFGESTIGLPLTVEEISEVLWEFVQKLNIEKPILLGHSYGGRVAIIYASKHPVSKLALVSSAGVKQKLKIAKKVRIKLYKFFKKCHISLKMGSEDYQNADNVKRIMLVSAVNTDLQSYMKKIKVPTLLIYGVNDEVTPLMLAKKIEKNIAGSVLIQMEECGHFPYLDRASYFSLILTSFLIGETYDAL